MSSRAHNNNIAHYETFDLTIIPIAIRIHNNTANNGVEGGKGDCRGGVHVGEGTRISAYCCSERCRDSSARY